ncbi:MAG: hypothetical protein IKB34_03630 [Clostridia bacterium]|nr:hypothetical protein [Clostridia bacterium]
MKNITRAILCGIIALVCLLTLLGYISSLVCDLSAFWVDPVPLFTRLLGFYFSNLDMATVGIPICGICLMLLYIDLKQSRDGR